MTAHSPLSDPAARPLGNAAAGLGALLAGLGVVPTSTRDTVESLVADALGQRGMSADIASLRYGHLVLSCDPQTAAFLRYDTEHLRTELNGRLEEPLASVRVKVARGR